ncbi:hypothetical protein [Pseudomonas sp. MWU12-2029]|uniref:hypothetical protein n=1 Tax=Pseudomonas sp. MWU12-2029 TaxID=2927805 RepID=UPI00200FABE0|nr:hypothetical protein [Pseudomonas sp. MWU12-2029]
MNQSKKSADGPSASVSYVLENLTDSFETTKVSGTTSRVIISAGGSRTENIALHFKSGQLDPGTRTLNLADVERVVFSPKPLVEYADTPSGNIKVTVTLVGDEYYLFEGTVTDGKVSNAGKTILFSATYECRFPEA